MLGLSFSIPDIARKVGAAIEHAYYVLSSSGTPLQVPRAIPDSVGTLFSVVDPVLSSDGTSYNPV